MPTLPPGTVVISGGARGVDSIVARLAVRLGYDLVQYPPDYGKYGKRAPLERNTLIVESADIVVGFPAPWSSGTLDTMRKAKAAGKPCFDRTEEMRRR